VQLAQSLSQSSPSTAGLTLGNSASADEAVAGPPANDEDEDETVEKGMWRPGQWIRRKFHRMFKNIVPVESIDTKSVDETREVLFDGSTEKPRAESVAEQPVEALAEEVSTSELPVSGSTENPTGELIIDHEDTLRETARPIINTAPLAAAQAREQVTREDLEEVSRDSEYLAANAAQKAFIAGEVFSRHRDRKLKREVSKVKKEAKSLKQEQKEVQKQQERVSQQLDRQLASKEYVREQVTAAEPRPSLPERQPFPSTRPPETPPPIEIHTTQPKESAPELQLSKPETILHQVETAAEQNVPIENLYERRHETKDEESDRAATAFASAHAASRASQNLAGQIRSQLDRAMPLRPVKSFQPGDSSDDMYRRAIRGGFWSAIILLILFLLARLIG